MSLKDKEKWDSKYGTDEYVSGTEPCDWLRKNSGFLNGKGKALDLAMGEGRNAVYLATLGYDVLGIDISEIGVKKAQALAKTKHVKINSLLTDLDNYALPKNEYDLIVCFNFLDRRLFPGIRQALKPGGLIFYETFTIDYLKYSNFKEEWVLAHNELLREFSAFRVLRYREVDQDETAFASILACKPE